MSTLPLDSASDRVAEELLAPLQRLRRRCRLYLAVEGAAQFALAIVGAALLQLVLDRWLRFSLDQRAVLNSVITVFWLWVAYHYLVARLLTPLSDQRLARWVDRANPHLHDQLSTAVELAAPLRLPETAEDDPDVRAALAAFASDEWTAGGSSPELVRDVLRDARRTAATAPVLDVLDHRRPRRRALQLVSVAALVAFAWVWPPDLLRTWFARNWLLHDIAWPQNTYLVPEGFDAQGRLRLARGEELDLLVRIDGEAPAEAAVEWRTRGGRRGRDRMDRRGNRHFTIALGQVTENVSFRLVGGDERTREYTVEAVEPPRVVRTRATITPPAYTGVDPLIIEQQTVLEILSGSTLEIEAEANKPLRSVSLVGGAGALGGDGLSVVPDPADPQIVRLRWQQPQSGQYRLELLDVDRFSDRNPLRFTLKVSPDRPPTAQMRVLGVGEQITPQAEFRVALDFEDAYGLADVGLRVQRGDDAVRSVPLPDFRPPQRRAQAELPFAAASLALAPGDRLRVWAEAADRDPAGPNVGRTPTFELRVVSAEDFLADLARRELEIRREFEQLLNAQRGLQEMVANVAPDLAPGEAPSVALSQRVAGLARQQAAHAGRSAALADRYAQILDEMRTNKVSKAADERRISEGVLDPLRRLAQQSMPEAEHAIAELRRASSLEQRRAVVARLDEILREMRAVLANMLEWEGYREVVELLREIMSEQGEIHEATLDAIEKQLNDILGEDESAEKQGAGSPP